MKHLASIPVTAALLMSSVAYAQNYSYQQQQQQQQQQNNRDNINRFYDQADRVLQQGRSYSPTPTYSAPSNSTPYVSPFQRY